MLNYDTPVSPRTILHRNGTETCVVFQCCCRLIEYFGGNSFESNSIGNFCAFLLLLSEYLPFFLVHADVLRGSVLSGFLLQFFCYFFIINGSIVSELHSMLLGSNPHNCLYLHLSVSGQIIRNRGQSTNVFLLFCNQWAEYLVRGNVLSRIPACILG